MIAPGKLLWQGVFDLNLQDTRGFPGGAVVKNPLVNAEDTRDAGSIPVLGRSSGGGNGNPLQCSYLGNLMDSGSWQGVAHGFESSQTQLRD